MNNNKINVAVYGSLKKGFGNSGLLRGQEYVGEGLTSPIFSLHSLGSFPGIVSGEDRVAVEVYKVDDNCFSNLDSLEGYPSFYNRSVITIEMLDGTKVLAWIYILSDRTMGESSKVQPVNGISCWTKENNSWR